MFICLYWHFDVSLQGICVKTFKTLAVMLNYTSEKQLSILDFKNPFDIDLDPNNRWVKLSKLIDWDAFAELYSRSLSSKSGARAVNTRWVLGALLIKHIENKDDRGTLEVN